MRVGGAVGVKYKRVELPRAPRAGIKSGTANRLALVFPCVPLSLVANLNVKPIGRCEKRLPISESQIYS